MKIFGFILDLNSFVAILGGFGSTLLLCVLLVLTKDWHGIFTLDTTDGIQKFHINPTPRIGGIAIFVGGIFAFSQSPDNIKNLLSIILVGGLPAFLFGVAEDLTKKVGVMHRLIATMVSGLLALWLSGDSIKRVDIWGVDWLLQFNWVSIWFTAFAVSGVANAINIIDGFNGLASTTTILGFVGYAILAWTAGDSALAAVSMILAGCIFGFFLLNWPFGKIFLGDGGSYFIGFALAWVAVLLISRNRSISAFAALLICIHPVSETLLSIFRRLARKEHPGMPDRLHFHSLVKRRYIDRWLAQWSVTSRNSATGVLVSLITLIAILVVPWVYYSPIWSTFTFFIFTLCYFIIYARMVHHRWF